MGSEAATGAMSEATIGRLKLASAIMGVLIILCLVLLVYGVSQKAGELSGNDEIEAASTPIKGQTLPQTLPQNVPETLPDRLELPAGMSVRSIATASQGGLWIFAEQGQTQHIIRIDAYGQLIQSLPIVSSDGR